MSLFQKEQKESKHTVNIHASNSTLTILKSKCLPPDYERLEIFRSINYTVGALEMLRIRGRVAHLKSYKIYGSL